jgi:hypothetical protein
VTLLASSVHLFGLQTSEEALYTYVASVLFTELGHLCYIAPWSQLRFRYGPEYVFSENMWEVNFMVIGPVIMSMRYPVMYYWCTQGDYPCVFIAIMFVVMGIKSLTLNWNESNDILVFPFLGLFGRKTSEWCVHFITQINCTADVNVNVTILWDVGRCSSVESYKLFGAVSCVYLQDRRVVASVVSRRMVMGCSCRPSGSLWVGIVGTLKNWNSSLRKSLVLLIKMDVLNKMVTQSYNRNVDNECWFLNKWKDVDVLCTNAVGAGR